MMRQSCSPIVRRGSSTPPCTLGPRIEVWTRPTSVAADSARATPLPSKKEAQAHGRLPYASVSYLAGSQTRAERFGSSSGRGRRARRRISGVVESLDGRVLLSTITVTSLADSGPGTLRSAIEQANLVPEANYSSQSATIVFAPSLAGTITLQSALPALTSAENIEGPGPSVITVARSSAPGTPDFGILTIPSTVTVPLTISGLTIEGGDLVGADGGGISNSGPLFLKDCVVAGNTVMGANGQGASGGGIYNNGVIFLMSDTIENNTITGTLLSGGGYGAGVFNDGVGELIVNNTTVQGNAIDGSLLASGTVGGAGIANASDWGMSISDSIIRDNSIYGGWSGGAFGGGVYSVPNNDGVGYVEIVLSTISGNSVTNLATVGGQGGGIDNATSMTLVDVTVVGNTAAGPSGGLSIAGDGGGIMNQQFGILSITYGTINGNVVAGGGSVSNPHGGGGGLTVPLGSASQLDEGGGIDNLNPNGIDLVDSIVAGNTSAGTGTFNDVAGAVLPSSTHNLIGDGSGLTGITNGLSGNLIGTDVAPVDPQLGPLASNGGPTPTEALLPGSPAIDAGLAGPLPLVPFPLTNSIPISTDQRGLPRFSGSAPDMGAYEVQAPPPKVVRLERFGDRSRTTQLVVSFSEALNPTTASNTANYRLVRLVKNGRGGFRPAHAVPIRLISYNPTSHSVTITPRHRLPLNFVYRLVLNGSSSTGLADPAGNYLDAKSAGAPGRDEFIRFGRGAIVLSSTRV